MEDLIRGTVRLGKTMFKQFSRIIDLDRPLFWGLFGKSLNALTVPVTTILIAFYFSPELQGYYYTFLSLAAMQTFVELGLTGVIATFASHEWANLTWTKCGGIEGNPVSLSRLSSLASFSGRWFLAAGGLITFLLLLVGFHFLAGAEAEGHQIAWRGPWVALSILIGLNVILAPVWAMLLGCGQIEHINVYRVVETTLRASVAWISLMMGAGLWTIVIAACAALIWSLGYLWWRYRSFFSSIRQVEKLEEIAWKRDIMPLQWRTALMWPSGYLLFSMFTPALFHYRGSVAAGQMGMSWSLIIGISGFAATWLNVKAPQFGALVAQKKFSTLDRITRRAGILSFFVCCIGGALLFASLVALDRYAPTLRTRLLPTLPIMIFMVSESLHQLCYAQSSYLRSFKQEPFMMLSIAEGWLVGILTIISAKYFGATAMSAGYLFGVMMALVWSSHIFVQCRREWIR